MANINNTESRFVTISFPKFNLHLIELLLVAVMPVWILASSDSLSQTRAWVGFAFILLVLRFIGAMFYGLGVFRPVKYDLALLTSITFLLLITILQGNSTYTNLGGPSDWGVGMIMLSGISIYVLNIITQNAWKKRLFFYALTFGLFVNQVFTFLFARPINEEYAIEPLALITILLSVAGLGYFRNRLGKVLFFFSLIIGVINLLSNFRMRAVVVMIIALLVMFLFQLLQSRLNLFGGLISNLKSLRTRTLSTKQFSLNNYGVVSLLGAIVLAVVLFIVSRNNIGIFNGLTNWITGYTSAVTDLSGSTQRILVGTGLLATRNSALNLFFSYGVAGVLTSMLMVRSIFYHLKRQIYPVTINGRELSFRIALLAVLGVYLGSLFIYSSPVPLIFVFISTVVLIYNLNNTAIGKDFDQLQLTTFANLASKKFLNRVEPEITIEFLRSLRLLATVVLIVTIPAILDAIYRLF